MDMFLEPLQVIHGATLFLTIPTGGLKTFFHR